MLGCCFIAAITQWCFYQRLPATATSILLFLLLSLGSYVTPLLARQRGWKLSRRKRFTRNQEPLWVLLWANKLPAATPLRSAPHPATRLCRNHAAGFWTPPQHVSFILCTWRRLMFSTSCPSTKRLRRGSTGKPSSLVVYETQFNERNLHLCFQRLGACCFGRHPVCRIFFKHFVHMLLFICGASISQDRYRSRTV